jgi:hypothetical protein
MLDRTLLLQGIIRWTARALSLLSTFMLVLFVVGEPFLVTKITAVEWLGLTLFPVGVVIGFAVAWWRERVGSIITLGSLVAFYLVFVFVMNERLTEGVWFLVFAFPAFLFLLSALLRRSQRMVTT